MHRHCIAVVMAAALIVAAGCKEDTKAECGDGKQQGEEQCDGTDFGGETCQTRGFLGGQLTCDPVTCTIGQTLCNGGCGNDKAEGTAQGLPAEEPCDGADLRGQNCTIDGFELGTVTCLEDCSGFDSSGCYDPTCGDGTIEGHEDCDPDVAFAEDCIDLGFNEGDIACSSTDCTWDTSGCITWVCGNGVLEGLEQCDGTIMRDDETCASLGHDEGELACFGTDAVEPDIPCRFDEGPCIDYVCGNDVVEGTEDCEPGVTFTEVCTDVGFASGDLACTAVGETEECQWDMSACVDGCGNDVIEGSEVCDGTDLDDQTCEGLGYTGGDLACQPTCDAYDETGCIA